MCGGGGSGTSKDQLKLQNQLQQKAFDLMQSRQNEVNDSVSKYLSGNVGFDPTQLALLRSQFLNSTARNYQTAGQNVRTALLRTGSADSTAPVGGDYVRGIAGLEGGLADTSSSGLANIDLQNLSQALTNKFNAASLINGQAAQLTSPISSFGMGANNALSNYVQSQQSTFGNSLFRNLGGVLGAGIGSGLAGGFGSLLSKVPGMASVCWIAEELYGIDSPKTHAIRAWLIESTGTNDFILNKFVDNYKKSGALMAQLIKTDPGLRENMQQLFDKFALQAMN